MTEAEVVKRTHRFLRTESIDNKSVVRLYTDAHATLLGDKSLEPFLRFNLDFGDMVFHPDMVGQLSDGECIFAVESKGMADMLKGLAQAEVYQTGFHYSFLSANTSAWTESLIGLARQKNVGVISVDDDVRFHFIPSARTPWRKQFQSVFRQMETVIQTSGRQTFHFNIPTHYLAWCIFLEAAHVYYIGKVSELFLDYPMPKDWREALAGAQKLGLVVMNGDTVKLTHVGRAVKEVLPSDLTSWARIHNEIKRKGNSVTLAQRHPLAASMLRVLLLQDPLVRLVIDGLEKFPNRTANFSQLASACDQLDHSRTPVFFLKPASAASLQDKQGRIQWDNAAGQDFRSTTFMQYKSILKHAGLLKPSRLGGSTAKKYDPLIDIWSL